jgi:hypothetical protein
VSLDEASVFLKSHHFGRRNNRGLKQDSRYVKMESHASVVDVRSFLGLVGYYRKFIEEISKITKPMTELLRKD